MDDEPPPGWFFPKFFRRPARVNVSEVRSSDVLELVARSDNKERKIVISKKTLTGAVEGIIYQLSDEKKRRKFIEKAINLVRSAEEVVVRVGDKYASVPKEQAVFLLISF